MGARGGRGETRTRDSTGAQTSMLECLLSPHTSGNVSEVVLDRAGPIVEAVQVSPNCSTLVWRRVNGVKVG